MQGETHKSTFSAIVSPLTTDGDNVQCFACRYRGVKQNRGLQQTLYHKRSCSSNETLERFDYSKYCRLAICLSQNGLKHNSHSRQCFDLFVILELYTNDPIKQHDERQNQIPNILAKQLLKGKAITREATEQDKADSCLILQQFSVKCRKLLSKSKHSN